VTVESPNPPIANLKFGLFCFGTIIGGGSPSSESELD